MFVGNYGGNRGRRLTWNFELFLQFKIKMEDKFKDVFLIIFEDTKEENVDEILDGIEKILWMMMACNFS